MSTFFDSRQIKTRKFYHCVWCGQIIVKGRMAQIQEYKDDNGEFQRDRMHPNCYTALINADIEDFEPYEQLRGGYDPDD
jgi:hypothetical protein